MGAALYVCVDEYFLPIGSCTGNQAVIWACFLFFVLLIMFLLISGPPKNKIDYGAHIYAFTNIWSITSSGALAIRLYNLYFVFDNVYEQLIIAVLATTGFILSLFDEEPVAIYYVSVTCLTTFYYFTSPIFLKTSTPKRVGIFLLIDCIVAISVSLIIFNSQPYANYIVIIASSIPRIVMYIYRDVQKIAKQEVKLNEMVIDRFRLVFYLISLLFIWTIFTYIFRFLAVLTRKNKNPVNYLPSYMFCGVILLCFLAFFLEKMGALLSYGILITLGLILRDYNNEKEYAIYFFEFFCFWVVCVPIWFEVNTYFPVIFSITSLYGVITSTFGSFKQASNFWGKAQYILHFFDFGGRGFSIFFILPLVAFGIWLLMVYGYQYFQSLIGQFISF